MTSDLKRVRHHALAAIRASGSRDEAIRKAHAQGATLREIADAAGLSHQRIHQIVASVTASKDRGGVGKHAVSGSGLHEGLNPSTAAYSHASLHDAGGKRKYDRYAVVAPDGSIVRTYSGGFAGSDARNEAVRLNRKVT